MAGQTIILHGSSQLKHAHDLLNKAPRGAIVNIRKATRSNEQNSRLWATLSDVARSKPQGRVHTADTWKCLFMQACGHAVQFEQGLSGEPFPVGFRSSKMTKEQMSELLEFIYSWGSENGVVFTDPEMKVAS